MLRAVQVVGPAAIFVLVASAEGAAFALSQSPSSEWLWFVNLKVFGLFQASHYFFSSYIRFPYLQLWCIAALLASLTGYGVFGRQQLALAIASTLSCSYAALLFLAELIDQHSQTVDVATLSPTVDLRLDPNLLICLALFAMTLLSVAASHMIYLRMLRRER